MNSIVSELYNFVASTIVPTVTEQATNLAGGASVLAGNATQAFTQISRAAREWSSGSEDTEVFSWEQQRRTTSDVNSQNNDETNKDTTKVDARISSKNAPADWEVVEESPEETGPIKNNQFEMVQNNYEWMKNSK